VIQIKFFKIEQEVIEEQSEQQFGEYDDEDERGEFKNECLDIKSSISSTAHKVDLGQLSSLSGIEFNINRILFSKFTFEALSKKIYN
jgi:hypothetical protein